MEIFQGHNNVSEQAEVSNAKTKAKDILVAGMITLLFFLLKAI